MNANERSDPLMAVIVLGLLAFIFVFFSGLYQIADWIYKAFNEFSL